MLVGICGAVWLVLLVVAVISTVALVKLGRGGAPAAGESSSWLLYTIIGISAATILAAIPLLLRARRAAAAGHADDAGASAAVPSARPVAPAVDAPTEKMRVFGATVDPYAAEPARAALSPTAAVIERLWLRGTASILTGVGLALIGVTTATYLLASHSETAAIVALAVAGVITLGLPAVLVVFNRRVGEALG